LNQPYLQEKAKADGSSSLSRLEKLIETADKFGRTPLLDSFRCKASATIELLVEAGADLKATDNDGNTAIILAASSSFQEWFFGKEDSPRLFKV